MRLKNYMPHATPIEWGLIAALFGVMVVSAFQFFGTTSKQPALHQLSWRCPAGTVMLDTSRFYEPVQPACVAGTYATLK